MKCEFGELRERMLLCRLVFGLSSVKMKERMLRDPDVTLDRAMADIRAAEVTKAQLSRLAEGDKVTSSIAKIDAKSEGNHSRDEPAKFNCKYCGYQHVRGRCPAYGKSCKKCGGKNHFAKKCTVKSVNFWRLNKKLVKTQLMKV